LTSSRVTATQPSPLDRRLGPIDAAGIVVSNVIGGGIFFLPIIVAINVGHPGWILFVWFAGGVLAFFGAMAYAELGALRPKAGGEYVYLRDAYGPLAGFLTGWTSFVAGFSGAIAANSLALADYMGRFVPLAADPTALFTIPLPGVPLMISPRILTAIAVIGLLTLVHLRGLGPGRMVQNVLAGAKVSVLVLLIVLGFAIGTGHTGTASSGGSVTAAGVLLAFVPVMFTYSGWNAAAYLAEEVRSPERNVPLALGLGTVAVIAIYMGLNALYMYAMPVSELAGLINRPPGEGRLIDVVGDRLFSAGVGNLLAVVGIVSMAASISAMVLAGPRVYFAMARDGLFPVSVQRIHPRFHAPTVAIAAQAMWSIVLVCSGTLSQLVDYTGFAIVLFGAVAVGAVFVLRRKEPDAPRPFKAWGYPVAQAIFVVASAIILVNDLWRRAETSFAGLAVILAGVPIYWWMRRRRGQ
jgi:APA family basic amino acid/polyamine antiporter